MEPLVLEPSQGLIACCECGAPITPNPANMCVGCVRSRVDITDGIPKQGLWVNEIYFTWLVRLGQLYSCRNCDRYFLPPNTWTHAKLESKELLSVCLKRLKPSMTKVRKIIVTLRKIYFWSYSYFTLFRFDLSTQFLFGPNRIQSALR